MHLTENEAPPAPARAVRAPMFQREKPHTIRRHIAIWTAVFFSWVFWLTPKPIRYWFTDRMASLSHRRSSRMVHSVQANLQQAAGGKLSEDDLVRHTRSVFRTSSRNFMDLFTMARMSHRALIRWVRVSDGEWAHIDSAIAKGRGVIFLTAHVGCFDFIGQLFRARGYKLTVVTGRTTSRIVFDGVTHLRSSHGNTMVEPTPSGVRSVIRALRRGECAVFLCDRDFFLNGHAANFFGADTTLPPGAIRLARDTGASIVPVFGRRERNHHQLTIMKPFTVTATTNVEADIEDGMRKMVRALEQGIGGNLEQWAMFQRVWP